MSSSVKYHLPPKFHITWPFILKVIKGEKKLIKTKDLRFAGVLPKLSQLQLKKIWPIAIVDKEFVSYLPDVDEDRLPPRNYFFQVLATIRLDTFNKLINEVDTQRRKRRMENNELVKVNADIWKELEGIKLDKTFVSATPSRRIVKVSKRRSQTD